MTGLLDLGFAHDRTTGKEDWLTPPHVLKALGEFDLDPCSPIGRPWDTAKEHYTLHDNGLNKEWQGRVWLNPPYGNETEKWMQRLAAHGDGIALIFARTETATFHPWVWGARLCIDVPTGATSILDEGRPRRRQRWCAFVLGRLRLSQRQCASH